MLYTCLFWKCLQLNHKVTNWTDYSVTSHIPCERWNPKLRDWRYCHVLPSNVTNNSWNACLTVRFIWPFLRRATTIHFTDLLLTNKSLVWSSRCNFWTICSAGLSLLLDWTEFLWTLWWTELELTVASLLQLRGEPNIDHNIEQFIWYCVYSLPRECVYRTVV
jgi:hypothetical protein